MRPSQGHPTRTQRPLGHPLTPTGRGLSGVTTHQTCSPTSELHLGPRPMPRLPRASSSLVSWPMAHSTTSHDAPAPHDHRGGQLSTTLSRRCDRGNLRGHRQFLASHGPWHSDRTSGRWWCKHPHGEPASSENWQSGGRSVPSHSEGNPTADGGVMLAVVSLVALMSDHQELLTEVESLNLKLLYTALSCCQFLALLDYVSRAHEIEIRLSSVRPSVRRWHRLSLNFMHGFLSNFSCGFPWATCPDLFSFKKIEFFTNIFRFR